MWRGWLSALRRLTRLYRSIDGQPLSKLSNVDLMRFWPELNQALYDLWPAALVPELGAYGGEPVLRQALVKATGDDHIVREGLAVLSAPMKPSFYQAEEISLLHACLSRNPKIPLQRHARKYFWLKNSYAHTQVLPLRFFQARARNIHQPRQSLVRMKQRLQRISRERRKFIHRLPSARTIRPIAEGLAFCIWWQDQRKQEIFRYQHYLHRLAHEIARRARVPRSLFDRAAPEEVRLRLTSSQRRRLVRRRAPFVLAQTLDGSQVIDGPRGAAIVRVLWDQPAQPTTTQLRGVVTCQTRQPVRGQVFVVRDHADIAKFPAGRILVATMTAPEYITAIRKARAIVTDTGGITSHAAIVSRELNIPCIVGTKAATAMFKNGDIIMVDTKQGIVKKG